MASFICALIISIGSAIIYRRMSLDKSIKVISSDTGKTREEVKQSYLQMVKEIKNTCKNKKNYFVPILCSSDRKSKKVNSKSFFWRIILIYSNWLSKLVLKDEKWQIAFVQSIGHEIGHKMQEPFPNFMPTKRAFFKNAVRECRADFYGVLFACEYYPNKEKQEILEAVKIKIDNNIEGETVPRIIRMKTHPKWSLRYKIMSEFTSFGREAIEYIASEVGYKNRKYIERLIHKAKLQ